MGLKDFLKEWPLHPGDVETIREVAQRAAQPYGALVQEQPLHDGPEVRVIDLCPRGDRDLLWRRSDAVVAALRAAGFDARRTLPSHSRWMDVHVEGCLPEKG